MKCTKCKNEIHGLIIGFDRPHENKQILLCSTCSRKITENSDEQVWLFVDAFIYWLTLNEDAILQFQKSDDKTQGNGNTSPNQTPDS